MKTQITTPSGAAYVESDEIIALGPAWPNAEGAAQGDTRPPMRMLYLRGGGELRVLDGPKLMELWNFG